MARVWMVVAALAVCLAQADEYGGVRMPQYDSAEDMPPAVAMQFSGEGEGGGGGGGGDYRGHSPDAAAPLDYKYEEDSQGNTEKLLKNVKPKSWKKPARKQRGLRHDRDDRSEEWDAATAEPFYNSESRWRQARGRSRARPEPERRRRRGRRGRTRLGQDDDTFQQMHFLNADYRVNNNHIPGEDVDTFTNSETTENIIRRKPRDRLFDNTHIKPLKGDDSDFEDLMLDRRLKDDQLVEHEEMEAENGRRDGGIARRPTASIDVERERVEEVEDEGDIALKRARHRPKDYQDYAYYGSKNLPMMVRRTTTRALTDSSSLAAATSSTTDRLAQLWTARRAFSAGAPAPSPPAIAPHNPDHANSITATSSTISSTSIEVSTESSSELSIAEKSRLSILKKSQKKEHEKGDPSKKPPVLLHVTSKMATIVMVEPPTSADPWMRARLVSGDPPQKLEKVKRLMRQKLVAGAKSIQELTDNWDDVVCDYIDMSLIDTAGAVALQAATKALLLTVAIVCCLVIQ